MRIVKNFIKWLLYVLLIPLTYVLISLILTIITIDRKVEYKDSDKTIYLSTNGVHLNIILEKKDLDPVLISGIKHDPSEQYLSFGWGDENFYLNTPTWGDLTFKNAFGAMFLNSTTLMHVTRYNQKHQDWVPIEIHAAELQKLNAYLLNTFKTDANGKKMILENKGYSSTDDFYKSKGSYSIFKSCNSWVNSGFKESGLKSCLWTPFDFGLLNKYE